MATDEHESEPWALSVFIGVDSWPEIGFHTHAVWAIFPPGLGLGERFA
jgi:hypothetical protein